MKFTDPVLKDLISRLSPFQLRCLERFVKGIDDSEGRRIFWEIKSSLKKAARAKTFARR